MEAHREDLDCLKCRLIDCDEKSNLCGIGEAKRKYWRSYNKKRSSNSVFIKYKKKYNKQYHQKNRTKILLNQKQSYINNREERLTKQKQYHFDNREERLHKMVERYHKLKNLDN